MIGQCPALARGVLAVKLLYTAIGVLALGCSSEAHAPRDAAPAAPPPPQPEASVPELPADAATAEPRAPAPERPSEHGDPLNASESRRFQTCRAAKDCIIVPNDCCEIDSGAEPIAIHKKRAAEFAARFDCEGTHCATRLMGFNPPLSVGCVQGRCTLQR